MKNYSLYSLMFVFVGASMQASQLQLQKSSSSHGAEQSAPEAELSQLSYCAEPSRYIADPSQISRPYSPSRSLIAASSSIKTVQQEEEKAQSSMPSIQDTVAAPKVIKYPLSDEIMHKAKRLEVEEKIKRDCLAMYVYLHENPSIIQDQIRAHAPQLSHYFVQLFTPSIQKGSARRILKTMIAHHDANNRWFKEKKDRDEFPLGAYGYLVKKSHDGGKLTQDLVQKLKSTCLLYAWDKMNLEVYAQFDDARVSIKEQLASIVSDPEELEALVEEELKKVAFDILKKTHFKYFPTTLAANNEAVFKKCFDIEYRAYQEHRNAFLAEAEAKEKAEQKDKARELEEKEKASAAKYHELAAAKQSKKDKKCVIQ